MQQINEKISVERDGDVLVIVIDNPPINAGSLLVRQGVFDAITMLASDPGLRSAVLIGRSNTFIAGSDLREFGQPLQEPQLPAVIRAIEDVPKPVVAALDGAALGGGFELALGCDARVATPGTVVGLPEVTLGMIPGAGGTQRLPRLVGVSRAIAMITAGERIRAAEANRLGIVDEVAKGDLQSIAVAYARGMKTKRRVRDLAVPPEPAEAVGRAIQSAVEGGRARPNLHHAIERVQAAAQEPIDDALTRERALFQDYRTGPDAFALRHLFFAEREAARPLGADAPAPRTLGRLAVIGGGAMGAGIAVCIAQAGLEVDLVERDARLAAECEKRLDDYWAGRVAVGQCTGEQAAQFRHRVIVGFDWEVLTGVDLAIEAVSEDLAAKQTVFRELDRVLAPGAVLASNTSSLDLDAIAAATRRPEDVIGLHFFSPAPAMKLLEVVRATASSEAALATGLLLARKLGKQPVLARNGPGLIGNRIFGACRRQCEILVKEGASPPQVDAALEAFGFATGPFAKEPAANQPNASRTVADDEIVRRAVGAMVNEALRLMEEGVAARPDDIDVALVHGCGFPRWRGGPLWWARQQKEGLTQILDEVGRASGPGFVRGDTRLLA